MFHSVRANVKRGESHYRIHQKPNTCKAFQLHVARSLSAGNSYLNSLILLDLSARYRIIKVFPIRISCRLQKFPRG